MGKRYISAFALCPFYRSEDEQKIYCEGVSDRSSIHVVFGEARDKTAYEKEKCQSRYMSCRVAQMLNRMYQEDEKNDNERNR